MAKVDVDGSCQFLADSQPKSIGLVWGLAATRRSVYIHQMNRVNSRNKYGHDDSTVNIAVAIIINIIMGLGTLRLLGAVWVCAPAAHFEYSEWSLLIFSILSFSVKMAAAFPFSP